MSNNPDHAGIPVVPTYALRSESGYGGGGTGPRGGISSFGVMGQLMPNRIGFDERTSQAFDRDFDPRDIEELRISLDIEKQSLRQKIIAMLRKEGIAEDLINAELAKYPSLENLRNAVKNVLSIAATLKKRGLPGAFEDSKDAIVEGVQGKVEDFQGKFEDAQDFVTENYDGRGGIFKAAVAKAREMARNKYEETKDRVGEAVERVGDAAGKVRNVIDNRADGGIMSLQSGGDVDLRDIAKRRSAEVYGDPTIFERFPSSPLQQQNPAFRGSQFFMPPGEVPNFNMGIMGLPGQMYANYYPAGPVGQMNPINKQIMGMPGGAQMPPPPGSEPPVTAPPPSQDTGMTGEIWDKPYEEAIPRPKRADFADGPYQGKKGSEAFKRALEEWNKNQKIWDSFETGAERKKYYLSGLDNLNFADGGSTEFPRKNGQISGPGTERSDDIPAMLSDGEFVVNAKAVRGIGSLMGMEKPKTKAEQRRQGARTMYALQNAGEKASGLRG